MLLNGSHLKYLVRSDGWTLSNSGVRPSYIFASASAPGGTGSAPSWPDGTMLSAVAAKSFALAVAGNARAAAESSPIHLRMRNPFPRVWYPARVAAGSLTPRHLAGDDDA